MSTFIGRSPAVTGYTTFERKLFQLYCFHHQAVVSNARFFYRSWRVSLFFKHFKRLENHASEGKEMMQLQSLRTKCSILPNRRWIIGKSDSFKILKLQSLSSWAVFVKNSLCWCNSWRKRFGLGNNSLIFHLRLESVKFQKKRKLVSDKCCDWDSKSLKVPKFQEMPLCNEIVYWHFLFPWNVNDLLLTIHKVLSIVSLEV